MRRTISTWAVQYKHEQYNINTSSTIFLTFFYSSCETIWPLGACQPSSYLLLSFNCPPNIDTIPTLYHPTFLNSKKVLEIPYYLRVSKIASQHVQQHQQLVLLCQLWVSPPRECTPCLSDSQQTNSWAHSTLTQKVQIVYGLFPVNATQGCN